MEHRRMITPSRFALLGFAIVFMSGLSAAHAVPTGDPLIVNAGPKCVFISTAGVDHGEKVAQEYADDLLKSDIAKFKASKKLASVRVSSRFRQCKFHLWFFGNEYNCTSRAKVCW